MNITINSRTVDTELDLMGIQITNSEAIKNSPKYGYLIGDDETLEGYGDTTIEANLPNDRYTVTIGDSLGTFVFSSRVDDVRLESVSEEHLENFLTKTTNLVEATNDFFDYVEVQIPGELRLDEFTQVQ